MSWFHHSHCNNLVSMSSSRISRSTTRMTQATRKQLKPAESRQTCHSAALRPQHGFSQFDLSLWGREGRRSEGDVTRRVVGLKINGGSCCGVISNLTSAKNAQHAQTCGCINLANVNQQYLTFNKILFCR